MTDHPLTIECHCNSALCPNYDVRHTVIVPTLQPGVYDKPDLRCSQCHQALVIDSEHTW